MGNCCPNQPNPDFKEKLVSDEKPEETETYDVVEAADSLSSPSKGLPMPEHYQKHKKPPIKDPNLLKYHTIKCLGKGSFGKVFLVKKEKTSNFYAMKCLKKEFIRVRNQISHTKAERQILAATDCNFIVKLHAAFQTPERLYLVMEYMPGGELFFHLKKEKRFSESRACFYAAELVLALAYLHSLGIAYRDLKPENILMDSNGHIKLADFGLSKEGLAGTEKSYTFCGTPEYLSPELISRNGHDIKVDWWTLGILIYEMITGRPPFKSRDRQELFRQILENKPEIRPYFSPEVASLIQQLLVHDPDHRLGALGAQQVMQHPFFREIDWEKLKNLEVTPPFIPRLVGGYDVSNFDGEFTNQIPQETPCGYNGMSEPIFQGFTYTAYFSKKFTFFSHFWKKFLCEKCSSFVYIELK